MNAPNAVRRALSTLTASMRGEAGGTVVEVLVAAGIGIVVLGATFAPMVTTQRAAVRASAWQDQLKLGTTQEARMMREIRQAYSVLGTTPNSIDFLISVAGTQEHVAYECDVAQTPPTYRECVRLQTTVGASLPALSTGAPIVTNVIGGTPADPVFGFTPDGFNPTYVTVHLEFPASSGSAYGLSHAIVINDGAYLRNMAVST